MPAVKPGSSRSTNRQSPPAKRTIPSKGQTNLKQDGARRGTFAKTLLSWWVNVSSERKIDILGGILSLIGLLILLSLVTPQRGVIFGGLVNVLFFMVGWGLFLLPLALIAIGLWLIFRHIKSIPVPSLERLTGILLLFLILLILLSRLSGGNPGQSMIQKGGGYFGELFQKGLLLTVGTNGSVVVLLAWILIGIGLTLDMSTLDLLRRLQPIFERLRQGWYQWRIKFQRTPTVEPFTPLATLSPPADAEELPSYFQPLLPAQRSKTKGSHKIRQTILDAEPGLIASEPDVLVGVTSTEESDENAGSPLPASQLPVAATAWKLPTVEAILDPALPDALESNQDQDRARTIEKTLDSFSAPGHVIEVHRGPSFTQFGVEPDFLDTRQGKIRVRVSKIISLTDDLALALAAPRIRIQAPVPGRNYVGIEVPNLETSQVNLRELLESEAFQKVKPPLRLALGKDVTGRPAATDLRSMPHLLIAGTTGSGKSVCINGILCCLLLHNTPYDLRLVLVDPKRVELTGYNGIPHLLAPVVVDTDRVVGLLQWILREMDSRYHKFSNARVRNIQDFNEKKPEEHLPYLVVVIDELADLMMLAPDEVERSITRLAQLARATGIHLILATQRPSVNVITGQIKANFPARIAFAVAQGVDSRVILDQSGAEKLLGRGDMLFLAPDASAPIRLQGAYVSDSEIELLVNYWKYNAAIPGSQPGGTPGGKPIDTVPAGIPLKQIPLWDDIDTDQDPMLQDAITLVRQEKKASVTMLERRLRIGYTRAARIVEKLEEMGIVGPPLPGSQVREILEENPTPSSESEPQDS